MGAGASTKGWTRKFHITSNVEDEEGDVYSQVYPVWSFAITNNQRQMATATSDNKINLWCLASHNLLIPLVGHADTIWKVTYSPDDSLLASASSDGTVRLWEVATGMPVMVLPRCHANWVLSMAWSPDGSRFVTGGSDARIIVWDALGAAEALRAAGAANEAAADDEYDMNLAEIAKNAFDDSERAKQPLAHWQAHEKSVNDLCFAPSETRMLASVGAEGTLAIWNIDTAGLDCRLMGHIGIINCVDICPTNEELIASGGEDHTVRLWDLSDLDPSAQACKQSRQAPLGLNLAHFTLKGHEGGVASVRFCKDGQLLASVSKDCGCRIWLPSISNPTLAFKWMAHEAWCRDLQWVGDQKHIYTAGSDGMVYAWEVPKNYHIVPKKEKAPKKKKRAD